MEHKIPTGFLFRRAINGVRNGESLREAVLKVKEITFRSNMSLNLRATAKKYKIGGRRRTKTNTRTQKEGGEGGKRQTLEHKEP